MKSAIIGRNAKEIKSIFQTLGRLSGSFIIVAFNKEERALILSFLPKSLLRVLRTSAAGIDRDAMRFQPFWTGYVAHIASIWCANVFLAAVSRNLHVQWNYRSRWKDRTTIRRTHTIPVVSNQSRGYRSWCHAISGFGRHFVVASISHDKSRHRCSRHPIEFRFPSMPVLLTEKYHSHII